MNDATLALFKKLNAIEAVARDMPAVGKRSELRAKADEIFVLLEEARQQVNALEEELNSLKYEYPAQQFKRVKGVKRGLLYFGTISKLGGIYKNTTNNKRIVEWGSG